MRSQSKQSAAHVNYARLEVERLGWPEEVSDPEGDELRRLQHEVQRWRAWAAVLGVSVVVLAVLLMLGGGK